MNFALAAGGICAILNLSIQALKLHRYKGGYLFEGCYFGAIIRSAKIAKIKCVQKYQFYNITQASIHANTGTVD